MMIRFMSLALVLWIATVTRAEDAPKYQVETIEGWKLNVQPKLAEKHPDELAAAKKLLVEQLQIVERVIPAGPLEELRKVPLYFSLPYEKFGPTAEYHPDADWLKEHGRDPAMAKCVEFTDVLIFKKEVERMPVFVLHELAHAYHDRVLGFDNAEVEAVYKHAMSEKLYDNVKRNDGKMVKHYATTNAKEFFAECSESFFGRNDFFPFDKPELELHDPETARLLAKLWKVGPSE